MTAREARDLTDVLVVWDVDGTLLDAKGAGHRALTRAVRAVTGHDVGLHGLDLAGQTDRQLMEEALRLAGAPARLWPAASRLYPDLLDEELKRGDATALPGVSRVLDLLADTGAASVLGTGNVEQGAYRKLAHVGLGGRFATGGFGDRHRTRPPVIRDAIRAGHRQYGRTLKPVVVGDTPRDAAAAAACGVPVVLVATGRFSVADLTPLSPWVLSNLADPVQALAVLTAAARGEPEAPQPGR
jgi:phosphoglycolate phosphatase